MKTKLIQIEDYLLLINEEAEIKEGDIVYRDTGVVFKITNERISYYREVIPKTIHKIYKCLAYYPLTKEAKELDLPLLPNPFEKEIGVEELACAKYNVKGGIRDYDERYYNTINVDKAEAFIEGYKAAQSKQLELLKRAIQLASDAKNIEEVTEEIIQSVSTQQLPKEFVPEYEYYYHSSKEFYIDAKFEKCSKEQYESIRKEIPTCPVKTELKTMTNSEGREELVGTYKY